MPPKKNAIDKYIQEIDLFEFPPVDELYKKVIGKSNIEKVGEEALVIRMLTQGVKKSAIVNALQGKHPKTKFSYYDLDKFMIRSDDLVRHFDSTLKRSARKHLQAKEDVQDLLATVTLYCKKRVIELGEAGDPQNEIAAIRALNQTVKNYMEAMEMTKSETEVHITTNLISDRNQLQRRQQHRADFKLVEE